MRRLLSTLDNLRKHAKRWLKALRDVQHAPHTLLSAVAMGDIAAIQRLAREGADLNQRMDRTNHRRTPLHLAVEKKQPQALAVLMELGADPNLEDAAGLTPLDQAALKGEREMIQRLLDGGAEIRLTSAIVLERPDDLERLIRANPELLTNNRQWARLIVRAGGQASGRVMETLLAAAMRHRAGLTIVNMEDEEDTAIDGAKGYTPLHGAAFNGNSEAAAVLLKHGANPRVRDGKYCATPAGWATYAGHTATCRLILESEIDIFDAIDADRGDRVGQILDRDPAAIDRPFKAYASCLSRDEQSWPQPDCVPLQWAQAQKKEDARRVLIERGAATRTPQDLERAERVVSFLQSACWDHHVHGKAAHRMHDQAAQRLLAHYPDIARVTIYTAVACGDLEEVRRILDEHPDAARERGGARGWTPLLTLCYTRFTHRPTLDNALAIARLLLDRGANPNDFYMAMDAAYTALVGVAGEGEQDAPRQPYAEALFDLLLERGAEPFDIQVLYNTHFSSDMLWWLQLVYKHSVNTARSTHWKDPDWTMFDMGGYGCGARFVLESALKKRNLTLAEWVLAHGANPNAAPARDKRFPKGTLYQEAVRQGFGEMADLLLHYGATPDAPVFTEQETFIQACFRLDRDQARAFVRKHPEFLQWPDALFVAAERDRPDVAALLLDLGASTEVHDANKERPLHRAAVNNALGVARLLLERGADIDPRESRYEATPIGWASHGDHADMVALLSRYTRDIRTLCFNGRVDRVRDLLLEDPSLARQAGDDGITPLWWLPDDEAKAMELVELLLAAGADPSIRSNDGRTAADFARTRGMMAVAARLSSTSA